MNVYLLTLIAWPFIIVAFLAALMSVLFRSDFIAKVGMVVAVVGVLISLGGIIQIWAHGPMVHLG